MIKQAFCFAMNPSPLQAAGYPKGTSSFVRSSPQQSCEVFSHKIKTRICFFLAGGLFWFGLLASPQPVLASTLYLSPGGGQIAVGGMLTVQVRLSTGGEGVNGVSAFLAYPKDTLEVAWVSGGSAFAIEAEKTFGGGVVKVSRGNINPVSGDVNVATVAFRGKAEGQGTVAFIGGSAAPRASDSSDSLNLGGSRGGVYTVVKGQTLPRGSEKESGVPETRGPVIEGLSLAPGTTATPSADSNFGQREIPKGVALFYSLATNSATIIWKTDKEADSLVEYGLEKDRYFLSQTSPTLVTNHGLRITSPLFAPGNQIHFRVTSKDASGRIAISPDAIIQLKGYTLKVRIADKTNQPLSNIPVFFYSEPLKAVTNAAGEVVFADITAGKHFLVAKLGSLEKSREVEVLALDKPQETTVQLDVVPQPPKKISARPYLPYLAALVVILLAGGGVFWIKKKRDNPPTPPGWQNPASLVNQPSPPAVTSTSGQASNENRQFPGGS